MKKAGGGLSE